MATYNWAYYLDETEQVIASWCPDNPSKGSHNNPTSFINCVNSFPKGHLCLLILGLSEGPKQRLTNSAATMAYIERVNEAGWRGSVWTIVHFTPEIRTIYNAFEYYKQIR